MILRTPNRRIFALALLVVGVDQLTKALIRHFLPKVRESEVDVIDGFFKLVHWENTGAAWSLFRGYNLALAAIAIVALVVLVVSRHHFNARTATGQVALGLICGGIVGNLLDRLFIGHVVDFIYFYIERPGTAELGFPAFNVADSAICVGVGLVFLITWKGDHQERLAQAEEEEAGQQKT